jgi:hypothetical protein
LALNNVAAIKTYEHAENIRGIGSGINLRRRVLAGHFYRATGGLRQLVQALGPSRFAEVRHVADTYVNRHDPLEPVSVKELRPLTRDEDVTVLDV